MDLLKKISAEGVECRGKSLKRYSNNFSLCRTESLWIPCTDRTGWKGECAVCRTNLSSHASPCPANLRWATINQSSQSAQRVLYTCLSSCCLQCHLDSRIICSFRLLQGIKGTENKINYAPKHDTENMTEQRCPAMKFCFFSSLSPPFCSPSFAFALARLCADGALMHRMLPTPATHIHTYIVYPHQALHLWWSQKFKFTAKEKRDKMNVFWFIFRIFLGEVYEVCRKWGECGVSGQLQQCRGCGFGNVRGLAGQQRGRRGSRERQLWEIWHLGASL